MFTAIREVLDPIFIGASCSDPNVDPELFHTETVALVKEAREMCLGCPHLEPCREWGLSADAPAYGTLGGLTKDERAAFRRERTRRSRAAVEFHRRKRREREE